MAAVAKVWRLLPHDGARIARVARDVNVPPIVAQLLINRGLDDLEESRRFLSTSLTGLRPPESLPGAAEAADRIWAAVQSRRRITVYGDYDVDGVTGTAILLQVLTLLGADVGYYVPKRLEEGYGLNVDALRQLAEGGTQVVVTVDCGITAAIEADEARRLGIELIVTDHHEFAATLPNAVSIVHPRLPGSAESFGGLSGAGVAFKVAWLVCQRSAGGERLPERLRNALLDAVALAAMGLVADVVPLRDENRLLVRHGLQRIKSAPTPGLRSLMSAAKLAEAAPVRAEDIAFRIAPRLNAAGRLGCARLVVELLTTSSDRRAQEITAFLELQNQQRQTLERKIVSQARAMVESDAQHTGPALVLAGEDWHPGVIGIVAGRISDAFGRPTLVIAIRDGIAVGSGRSIPGYALHEALEACAEHLIGFGGHAAAVGFRLDPSNIPALRERLCEHAATAFRDRMPAPELVIDAEVPLSSVTPGLIEHIDRLEPFGAQNPRPKFMAAELTLVGDPRRIGGGERHLSFRVRHGSTTLRAVAWSMGERLEELTSGGGQCSVVLTPRINEWNGYRSVEMEVIDFQPRARPELR